MPQRSNHFQRLVFRLQSTLHDTDCVIQESAMVQNHSSGNKEEIDVLVTFTKGDLVYRTAFACRDHARPASPGWIRDLAKQREHCRLDKMVAFHSKGFSGPARKSAENENIAVFTTEQIEDVDLKAAMELPAFVICVSVAVNFEERVRAEFPWEDPDPSGMESGLAAMIVNDKEMSMLEFHNTCRALITEWCSDQLCREGKTPELPMSCSQESTVRFRAWLPENSIARLNSGDTFRLAAITGRARIRAELKFAFNRQKVRVGTNAILDAEVDLLGRAAQVLMVSNGEKLKSHFEASPGTDMKIEGVSHGTQVPQNPFQAFEVAWEAGSVVIAGPGI